MQQNEKEHAAQPINFKERCEEHFAPCCNMWFMCLLHLEAVICRIEHWDTSRYVTVLTPDISQDLTEEIQ